jgi:heptose I phosphotransferase
MILTPPFDAYSFQEIMCLKGEVFRALEGRVTQRIFLNNQAYFIKQHHGIGWKEFFKNIFQCRLPVCSAKNEFQALRALETLNIPSPQIVAFGKKGINPAAFKSFIITKALPTQISLEDFCKDWLKNPPPFLLKQKLIKEVARIMRVMHARGINHRDCYICHFLLDLHGYHQGEVKLYLIDLHRALFHKRIPLRWVIKDLSGLYFSSKNIGLNRKDLLRFMKEYRNKTLRNILSKESIFWKKVAERGDKLYGLQRK